MKSRVVLSVLVMMSFTFAAKIPNDTVVDSGSFGVYVNGTRVATETFKVEQRANGSLAKSELKAQGGGMQRSELELTPKGEIVRYGWQQLDPKKEDLSVVPKDEFLSETISLGPNEKSFTVPHLMPHSTPILDDNFFLHREILLWRYLASGCTPQPEGLSCNPAPQQYGVLIPAQHSAETVTLDFKDKEKISVKGKEIECNAFRLHSEDNDWLIYMNDQQKVVRIVASAIGLEVVRD
jgi:hypothetical protein